MNAIEFARLKPYQKIKIRTKSGDRVALTAGRAWSGRIAVRFKRLHGAGYCAVPRFVVAREVLSVVKDDKGLRTSGRSLQPH